MRTLFERFLLTETSEMFLELAGHAYTLKALCSNPDAGEYEESYLAIVSRNTKPDETPWRMTVYSQKKSAKDKNAVVHIQLDDEYSYLNKDSDELWEHDILDAVREYINPDCNFLEPKPITEEEMMNMISTHISH